MARECKIKRDGGKITVKLSVNNGIISGGDFAIYEFETGTIVKSFKMHTDTSGTATSKIDLTAKALMAKVLSWQILSCSPIITDSCNIDIEVIQDTKVCAMNKPAHYSLSNIPNCSVGQSSSVKGGLHFVNQLTPEA